MHPKRLLGAVVALAFALSGCGSTHPAAASHATAARPLATAEQCTPADQTMGCVLDALPQPPANLTPRALPSTYGIDFAWSSVSAARAKALGAHFGASYLSTDLSKNWTAATVTAYHQAGLATVAVWETQATRALAGFSAGQADARSAAAQAIALGEPASRPIFFAVDFDETPGQAATVASYFRGVGSVLGVKRTGAYGGYWVISRLFDAGLIGYGWQTYAWSGGLWDARAHLQQYLNGPSFDNDRGIAADYGQWPAPAVPARVLPVCFHRRLTVAACAAVKAKVASDGRAVAASQTVLTQALATERTMRWRIRWFTRAATNLQGAN